MDGPLQGRPVPALLLLSRPLSGSQGLWLELGAQWAERDEEAGRSSLSGEWNLLTNPGLGQGFAQDAYGRMCVHVRACLCVRVHVRACPCVSMRACARVSMRACPCVRVRACGDLSVYLSPHYVNKEQG